MPKVINLRDTGGRTPPGAVRIDMLTKWRNPFILGRDGTRAEVVAKFRALARTWVLNPADAPGLLSELRGKDLACWCAPEACHGDVLLELANREELAGVK